MVKKKQHVRKIKNTQEKILVLCVDRDNDIGKLLGVSGPIIGYENNLKLATDLILTDPEESDANAIFGALKKYNDLKKKYVVEVVTLTGYSKENLFFSDKNIINQLQAVLKEYSASGVVFISDGAEDDEVIPIIQNYVPIISKEVIIVKQSKHIESIFYTIKKSLKDPVFARIIFGVPAIILLLLFFIGTKYTVQILTLVLGVFFLIKGFDLEPKINYILQKTLSKFSIQKISFPFNLAGLFFLIFAMYTGINLYASNLSFNILFRVIYVFRAILLYFVISACSFIIGEIIDLFYFKELYKLGKSLFSLITVIVFSSIIDISLQLIINEVSFNLFLYSIIISTVVLYLVHLITKTFDVTTTVTELFIGLPVISKYGLFLGEITDVDEKKQTIKYLQRNLKTQKIISKDHFIYNNGRIII
jgi:putative membrane protein